MEIPNGYLQCNLLFTGSGFPSGAQVTFGCRRDVGSSNDPVFVAGQLSGSFQARYMPLLSSSLTCTGALVKFGPNVSGPAGQNSLSVAGSSGAATVGPGGSYLIQKRTASGGRAGRGRWYIPGVADADVDNTGAVTGAKITALNTAGVNMLADLNTVFLPMVVLHAAAGAAPVLITSLPAQAIMATQRRRQRR